MSSVSVIIPTYNGGEHLLDAVNSVLQQTLAPLEIIVVDDGSQEDVLRTLSSVSQRISYIRQDNAGPSAARNRGIKAARGEFIAFLDDDDLWHPTKIEAQLRCMSQDPACGLVYSIPDYIDSHGSIVYHTKPEPCPSGYVYYDFLKRNYIYTPSTTLIRASVFEMIGVFDENTSQWEDYDLWMRIAKHYNVLFCSVAIIYYRLSDSGISKNTYNHLFGYLYVMSKILKGCIEDGTYRDNSFIDAISKHLRTIYRDSAYKVWCQHDDRPGARRLMTAALRKGQWSVRDVAYLILFSLPEPWFECARNVKRILSGKKVAESRKYEDL